MDSGSLKASSRPISRPEPAASAAGIRRGDLLLAIDDRPVQQIRRRRGMLRGAEAGQTARYTILRLGTREVVDLRIAPIPSGPRALYYLLAAVGIFTLLVGGAVRLRRPRDPATLHFFWLWVAFFGVFTFSFSGRLDRLDWVFYWADAVSMLALAAVVSAFHAGVSRAGAAMDGGPDWSRCDSAGIRASRGARSRPRRAPSRAAAATPARFVRVAGNARPTRVALSCRLPDRGLAALARALSRGALDHRAPAAAMDRVGHGARRQRRSRSVMRLPFALGVDASLPMQLSAIPLGLIPLAYASAIVRYRLMDIEVIVKRALVYAAALGAIVAIYAADAARGRARLAEGRQSNTTG